MTTYPTPSVDHREHQLEDFRLIKALGHGSFATAYLARQIGTEREVVVKIAHPHMITGPHGEMIRKRFDAEARAIARIQHPNMATIYTSGLTRDAIPYIAMEFVQGRTLDATLRDHAPLPLSMTHAIFDQIASVLKSAHSLGVIHRDITPSNIMLQAGPSREPIARVLDFGLAMLDEQHTHTVGPVGTPRYLAPEQLGGQPTTRSDMFSMGAILWWALTGREYLEEATSVFDIFRIYNSNLAPLDPRTISPNISPQLAALVASLLQPDPISRPDAVTFLQRWRPLAPRPTSDVFTSVKSFQRRPASSGEWMRPGSQPRHSAPRVTTFTGIGLGESSSAAIASGLPQQQQLLEGVSIVHMCDDPIRRLRTETHLEQHGALITAVERFDQLLVELVQQQHEVVVLDSSLIIPHLTTVDQIVNGMPTPSLVVFIAEQQLNSMPASVSFLPRPDLFTHLTSTLHAALDSPQRRILIELKDDRAFNPQTLAPLLNSPASLDALLVSFIGDTPELLAQIEEALDLADLALARGFNNALYDNASRLGLDAISHATASLATSLQPQGAAQAPLLLAQVEHEYMTAFSTILKLRSMLQNLT